MGKFNNAEIYRQLDRQRDNGLDGAAEGTPEPPLSESERAAGWDNDAWGQSGEPPRTWRIYGGW